MVKIGPNMESVIKSNVGQEVNLSAKLERVKKGLISDTIRMPSYRFPSLKESQFNYGLKCGRLGTYDPLRKRSKMFRQAVNKYAPPYYFWHKEFINSMKLKRMEFSDKPIEDPMEGDSGGNISCIWCHQLVPIVDYVEHKTKRCKKRHDFVGVGYYQCSHCREGFIDDTKAKEHILLHFPTSADRSSNIAKVETKDQKNIPIICRDQAKRKKWL